MQPNLKVCVLDNGGYLSIKQTQRNFFGREFASSLESGVSFPDYTAVARAFGLPSARLGAGSWKRELPGLLDKPGPQLIHVHLDPLQEFEPRVKSRMVGGVVQTPELEDMFPFLTQEELESVMASVDRIQ
jgi:acetolactate synthase-1/2/3 large subunit